MVQNQVSEAGIRQEDAAIRQLLVECAEVGPGKSVLFINEPDDPAIEPAAISLIEQAARHLGADVRSLWVGPVSGPEAIPAEIMALVAEADATIFNHGMGGMLRLKPAVGQGIRVLNYATSLEILRAPWTRISYPAWEAVHALACAALEGARHWRVTCPLGTDLRGSIAVPVQGGGAGVKPFALRTFPTGTHRPLTSHDSTGTLAIRWLASSANHDIGPGLCLDATVLATVEAGRILALDGESQAVDAVRTYLEKVGRDNGKDPYLINSWHAGTNPLAFTPWQAREHLNTWQLLTHNHPRLVHFHVVGTEMPGELSVAVLDHRVELDGEVFWDRGRFMPLERAEVRAAAERAGIAADLEHRADRLGL